ncbi:hypothetical protein Glove_217g51 [Diversispora epigaea]|uniref:Crinkler effector protein N-terminal domain-containing protein n=1 Tax=Diversispora epigaea TaxID=1348612 RepID=A0A397IJW7_9GLOM|nr:hypothetical protein Glove_217g51 [Diversispora epigaea]
MSITLFCFIKGNFPATKNAFPIKINEKETIGELKKVIKAENPRGFTSIDAKDMKLWKVRIKSDRDDLIQNLTLRDNDELLNTNDIEDYWTGIPTKKHIHVIIDLPELIVTPKRDVSEFWELIATLRSQVETSPRKRKAVEESKNFLNPIILYFLASSFYLREVLCPTVPVLRKKKWTINETIKPNEVQSVYFVDPAFNEKTTIFVQRIIKGSLLMLTGARASGKSTRVYRLIQQLHDHDYICLYTSFKYVIFKESLRTFWNTLGNAIKMSNDTKLCEIHSSSDFLNAFAKDKWDKKFILFLDEFDKLYDATDEVRNNCLEIFRGLKNTADGSAIVSIVATGTFSIRFLNSSNSRLSPFNVADSLNNPYFSEEEVKLLFDEFATDRNIKIDSEVVKDIYVQSNGHPGLICFCGRSIDDYLIGKIQNQHLDSAIWQSFSVESLHEHMLSYLTFRKMIKTLTSEISKRAMELLRFRFLGFLVNEGVLLMDEATKNQFKISSAYIDGLIRRHVVPKVYPSAPQIRIPRTSNGSLAILKTLKESIRLFDKEIISRSSVCSYKRARVKVDGLSNKTVPRESVYDTELSRVLFNWLPMEGFIIIGQWNLIKCRSSGGNYHRYSNIVITTTERSKIVLELLATATKTELEEHFMQALDYAKMLSAGETWIVHFTREFDIILKPHWPSDEQQASGLNVVHFWHDEEFTNVRMSSLLHNSAGEIYHIINQPVAGGIWPCKR